MLIGSKKCDKVWNLVNFLMFYYEIDKVCSIYYILLFLKFFFKNFVYIFFMLVFYLEKE